jgi:hypothetical protein
MSHHIVLGCFLLLFAIYLVDNLIGRAIEWRKRRESFLRDTEINRYNMGAFRGARKFDDPRWPS